MSASAFGPNALARLGTRARDAEHHVAMWLTLDHAAAAEAIWTDAATCHAVLYALCDATSAAAQRLARFAPELHRLATPLPAMVEHDAPSVDAELRPLFDHSIERALVHWLGALERNDRTVFAALRDDQWQRLQQRWGRLVDANLAATVRFALAHLDCSKAGSLPDDIDPSVHNLASAELVARSWQHVATPVGVSPLVALGCIANHGLTGQTIRGELPTSMMAAWHDRLASVAAAAKVPLTLIVDALAVIDICDTAAVRTGLLTAPLADRFEALHSGSTEVSADDATMLQRFAALRASRTAAGETDDERTQAWQTLLGEDRAATAEFTAAFAQCQLWYCEAALAALAPATHLLLLAAAVGVAQRAGVDTGVHWHVNFARIITALDATTARGRYRIRLLETSLSTWTLTAALRAEAPLAPLGAITGRIGSEQAVWFELDDGEEGGALITLLAIYERKSSTAFHSTLKALCDLYGLRKDQFDRVANEANYLATMNAARSDKERMLDWVQPGTIVEVGPGGGVVLDLLEQRYPTSTIIGIDISSEVIAALTSRKHREQKHWNVRAGDAFALPTLVPPGSVDTVVYCSILHEIYSYVERPSDTDPTPRRFRIESVRDLLRATWATLRRNGRIVIRDGVLPPPGVRRLRFVAPDARDFFDQFVAQFEGRRITFSPCTDGVVELSAADAMEFLYTYTWGPASFPYEVREQYGVMTYHDYVAAIIAWVGGPTVARAVELPVAAQSYLQPGYQTGLAGKVDLLDQHNQPVTLPDSNCLIVIEKLA